MPRPRLENIEFWNEHVHIGVEFDQKAAWVVVIGSEVVARSVPCRAPEHRMARRRKKIRRIVMRGAAAQLKGKMVNAGLRRRDDIEDVVIAVAGQKRRDPLEPIRRTKPDGRTEFD